MNERKLDIELPPITVDDVLAHVDPLLSPSAEPVNPLDLRSFSKFAIDPELLTPNETWLNALRAGVEIERRNAMEKIAAHYCAKTHFTSEAARWSFVAERCASSPVQALSFDWD